MNPIRMPDAKKKAAIKVKVLEWHREQLSQRANECVKAIQRYKTSKTEQVWEQIFQANMEVQKQADAISAIFAELQELKPEEAATYRQHTMEVYAELNNLKEIMEAFFTFVREETEIEVKTHTVNGLM